MLVILGTWNVRNLWDRFTEDHDIKVKGKVVPVLN
jgi:hypothetical protein